MLGWFLAPWFPIINDIIAVINCASCHDSSAFEVNDLHIALWSCLFLVLFLLHLFVMLLVAYHHHSLRERWLILISCALSPALIPNICDACYIMTCSCSTHWRKLESYIELKDRKEFKWFLFTLPCGISTALSTVAAAASAKSPLS